MPTNLQSPEVAGGNKMSAQAQLTPPLSLPPTSGVCHRVGGKGRQTAGRSCWHSQAGDSAAVRGGRGGGRGADSARAAVLGVRRGKDCAVGGPGRGGRRADGARTVLRCWEADGARTVREADGARTVLRCGRRMERGRCCGAVRPGRRGADGAAMLGG